MKIFNLLLGFLLLCSTAIAQEDPYFIKTFGGQRIYSLNVTTSGGYIKVKGVSSESYVHVYVKPNSWNSKISDQEIKERLEKYTIDIKVENGTLICEAKPNKDINLGNKGLSISFEVGVPKNIDADLKTSGGSITLNDLNGKLRFKTSGGSMTLANLSGNIQGLTSGGSIKLDNSKGDIDLKTSGGSIKVNNVNGDMKYITSGGSLTFENMYGTLEGKTSGGSIKINNFDGKAEISTSGGSIQIVDTKGDMKASTSGGGIEGKIIKVGSVLDLSTSAGNIRVDLPFGQGMDLDLRGNKIVSTKLEKFSSTLKEGKVYGRINGGGSTVKMRTSAGSIYVD